MPGYKDIQGKLFNSQHEEAGFGGVAQKVLYIKLLKKFLKNKSSAEQAFLEQMFAEDDERYGPLSFTAYIEKTQGIDRNPPEMSGEEFFGTHAEKIFKSKWDEYFKQTLPGKVTELQTELKSVTIQDEKMSASVQRLAEFNMSTKPEDILEQWLKAYLEENTAIIGGQVEKANISDEMDRVLRKIKEAYSPIFTQLGDSSMMKYAVMELMIDRIENMPMSDITKASSGLHKESEGIIAAIKKTVDIKQVDQPLIEKSMELITSRAVTLNKSADKGGFAKFMSLCMKLLPDQLIRNQIEKRVNELYAENGSNSFIMGRIDELKKSGTCTYGDMALILKTDGILGHEIQSTPSKLLSEIMRAEAPAVLSKLALSNK